MSFAISSAKPIEEISPDIKKNGRREGIMMLAQTFNASFTASENSPGFNVRTNNAEAIIQALKKRTIYFLIYGTPFALIL
ncbi:MAG: hypothetical protein E7420_02550 [Ruminococcaceae bacterium]|nr:hypothetical protein [Oscillospiraceae bacterium]